ncbi:AAA-type ATPase [Theobroma cacao]|nr:AAA-type ATPase [Theobroma cacao]
MIFGGGIVADVLTSLMLFRGTISKLVPDYLTERIKLWQERLKNYFFPSIRITFDEFTSGLCHRSDAYIAIEYYLSSKSIARVTRLKAESYKRKTPLLFSSDHYEDIEDEFEGIKVTWHKGKHFPDKEIIYSRAPDDKNYCTLVFHPKDRDIVMERYLNHVLQEGKAIKKKKRQRKLYMNSDEGWDYTLLEHPAKYYSKIGKAWKRGYLLYGPPRTGKSTLILAMSNFLGYDIYDLELITVKDNAHLKTLLLNSSRKGIFVVEDINCFLDIT